jgi:hypothetical protein
MKNERNKEWLSSISPSYETPKQRKPKPSRGRSGTATQRWIQEKPPVQKSQPPLGYHL